METACPGRESESSSFDDSGWKAVTLPHAWNEDKAFAVDIHDHSTGIAWYRKRFDLSENTQGRKVFLEFEGVRPGWRVYVNGREAGRTHNGVMAFGLDITDLGNPAPHENTVAVWSDNDWGYRDNANQRFQWPDKKLQCQLWRYPEKRWIYEWNR